MKDELVESACDPRLDGCHLPLTALDSAFLAGLEKFFKPLDSLPDSTERVQCQQMFEQAISLRNQSFNRPANSKAGIFRGSATVGYGDEAPHGGATIYPGGSSLHLDGYVFDSRHDADSAQTQSRAAAMILHEAAHTMGAEHNPPEGVPLDYRNFDFFKYVIAGDSSSCVKNFIRF